MVWLNALARHFQAQVIQARERAQVGAIKGSIGHVEVFQMDGVGTPIIGRPRPLPGHDTPNPANNTYTLNYEEPVMPQQATHHTSKQMSKALLTPNKKYAAIRYSSTTFSMSIRPITSASRV